METPVHRTVMNIAVVDLGTSNIRSLASALAYLGAPFTVTVDRAVLDAATHLILPGVGAFDAAMARIAELDLSGPLRRHALLLNRPLLGVCLGMQLLFDDSEEGVRPGLGLVSGSFRRLTPDTSQRRKVPHVGFAPVHGYREEGLFQGLQPGASFYFTHSYALPAFEDGDNLGWCDHSQPFVAAFQRKNVCGAQFHPEKSQSNGLKLLGNFLELV